MDTIYSNLISMMSERNYYPSENKPESIKIENFNIFFQNSINSEKIYIFYITVPKVGINEIKKIITELDEYECNRCIVIYNTVLTSFAKQFISTSNKHIELFSQNDFQKDIYKHYLVPKHVLLNKNERINLLKYLKVKEENLPKINKKDPISKYFGAVKGDILKIYRDDYTELSTYYRVCV